MQPRRAFTPDGVTVAVHDLGGDGPAALFAHATGFHARVFGPLASQLKNRLHCHAPDLRGHGQSGVPAGLDFAWSGFGLDVLTALDALGLERPIGIGHSCGGAALLLAEEARPGTFSSLYLYEPVVLPPDRQLAVLSEPLAKRARQRREVFSSRAEAFDNYASKPPLDSFDREVLAAYVEYGFEDLADDTVRLCCRGENEARIYENGPRHHAFSLLGAVKCPVVLVCGGDSLDFTPSALGQLAERLIQAQVEVLPGLGHFGPLEHPELVAASVIRALDPPPA